ncbi:hypothetical protein PT286_01860 [Neisseriaceae bacterium ESL0693]|nr:hypothetical protein [Neisseriaceae bacterium ESL0693]
MRSHKLMLLGVLFALFMQFSYAKVYIISEMVSGPIKYDVVKEVCEHNYSNKEIRALEKAADRGNSLAQLKLGILYDIRSMQRYQQVRENQSINNNSVRYEDKRVARVLAKQRSSPCTLTKNTVIK